MKRDHKTEGNHMTYSIIIQTVSSQKKHKFDMTSTTEQTHFE